MTTVDPRLTSRDELVARATREVVHAAPAPGTTRTTCCWRTPTTMDGATFSTDPDLVTCDPIARAAGDEPPLREPHEPPAVAPAPPVPWTYRILLTGAQARRIRLWRAAALIGASVPPAPGDDAIVARLLEIARLDTKDHLGMPEALS